MNTILNNSSIQQVHFIGVGGIGMSGLAEILLDRGYRVSGSDQACGVVTSRLGELGVKISQGHHEHNVRGADAVVYSSAINSKNPEFLFAQQQGLPLIQRGQLLAELIQEGQGIVVAGTHGKTTTTGLISYLLTLASDPTYIIGGLLRGNQSTVRIGKGREIVAEADESDASFLYLTPHIAIVTNIEADHLENYQGDFCHLKNAFVDFLQHLPAEGLVIACIDDPVVRELLPKMTRRVITYGFSEDAQVRGENFQQVGLKSSFQLSRFGVPVTERLILNLPGIHNALNALAAVAVAYEHGISDEMVFTALAQFPGMGRRFHPCGEIDVGTGKALLFNDYGHHPTEIRATIAAVRSARPDRRLIMAFQPHRYSRTQALLLEFSEALQQADVLLLLEIYSAGEQPIEGINSEVLLKTVSNKTLETYFVPRLADLPKMLHEILRPQDIVFLQGAGNIESMVTAILENQN